MDTVTSEKLFSIQKRLQLINCPYIEDADEQCLLELLLHPGERRVKLLSWIVIKFDPQFHALLDESIPIHSHRGVDSNHHKLLLVLNIMGLVKADDLELVRGSAPQKKQLLFWDELVNILYTSQVGAPYLESSKTAQDSSYTLIPVVNDLHIHDLLKESCSFIDVLVRQHRIRDIFSSEIKLLSPDLEGVIKDSKNAQIPNATALKGICAGMSSDLKELTNQLDKMEIVAPDDITVGNYCRKIDLTLKTFSQMIDNFLYCHNNDIGTWCSKGKKPALSELGPATKTVSNMHSKPCDLINAVGTYNGVSSYLCDKIKKELEETAKILDGMGSTVDRETCTLMQNSINRRRLSSK